MLKSPLAALADLVTEVAAIDVLVKIGVSVDVNVDVSPAPIAVSPGVSPRSAEGNAGPEGKHRPEHIARRIPGIGWIGRIGPRAVNHGRVIGRDIHDLRISWLDLDDLLLDNDFLLLCRLKIPGGFSLGAQSLNGIHYVFLL